MRPTRSPRRPIASLLASFAAILFVGALAITPLLPAAIVATGADQGATPLAAVETRVLAETGAAAADSPQTLETMEHVGQTVERDGYGSAAAPPPPPPPAESSIVVLSATGLVMWPVPSDTRISSGFGPRSSPCDGCSTDHDGLDMNAGDGAAIQAMADGVVVTATDDGGGYGSYVEIEHQIGGEKITSLYAHMQSGSIGVSVGDQVGAGTFVGAVGSTGQATGPHLHLELFGADGVRFDPYAWLTAHAG